MGNVSCIMAKRIRRAVAMYRSSFTMYADGSIDMHTSLDGGQRLINVMSMSGGTYKDSDGIECDGMSMNDARCNRDW